MLSQRVLKKLVRTNHMCVETKHSTHAFHSKTLRTYYTCSKINLGWKTFCCLLSSAVLEAIVQQSDCYPIDTVLLGLPLWNVACRYQDLWYFPPTCWKKFGKRPGLVSCIAALVTLLPYCVTASVLGSIRTSTHLPINFSALLVNDSCASIALDNN